MQCDIDCHVQPKVPGITSLVPGPEFYTVNSNNQYQRVFKIGFLHVTNWDQTRLGKRMFYGRIHGELNRYPQDVKYILSKEDADTLNRANANGDYAYVMGEESSRFMDYPHLSSMACYEAQKAGYNTLVVGEMGDKNPLPIVYGPKGASILNQEYKSWDAYHNDPTCQHVADYIAGRWRAIARKFGFHDEYGLWRVKP